LEGARAPCAPRLDPPMYALYKFIAASRELSLLDSRLAEWPWLRYFRDGYVSTSITGVNSYGRNSVLGSNALQRVTVTRILLLESNASGN